MVKTKNTNIELIVAQLLSDMQLKYKKQYKIGNFKVDFYLPKYNLTIQTDGCYWHFCEECSKKQKKIYSRQRIQKYRDRGCLTYHKYKKISLLRLKECDIVKDLSIIENKIIESIQTIDTGKLSYNE